MKRISGQQYEGVGVLQTKRIDILNKHSQRVKREKKVVKASVILTAVAKQFSCNKKELLTLERGGGVDNTTRALAMKLCQENGSMKLSELVAMPHKKITLIVSYCICIFILQST